MFVVCCLSCRRALSTSSLSKPLVTSCFDRRKPADAIVLSVPGAWRPTGSSQPTSNPRCTPLRVSSGCGLPRESLTSSRDTIQVGSRYFGTTTCRMLIAQIRLLETVSLQPFPRGREIAGSLSFESQGLSCCFASNVCSQPILRPGQNSVPQVHCFHSPVCFHSLCPSEGDWRPIS